MKKFVKVIAIIFVVLVVVGVGAFFVVKSQDVPVIAIDEVDLSKVKDGTYVGSHDADYVNATVEVTVKDNKMTSIVIKEHKNKLGKQAEVIINDVQEAQTLAVDNVSGATLSSQVILKAIEKALNQGIEN
jgi:uncharacterized protein with FMN-binding domain